MTSLQAVTTPAALRRRRLELSSGSLELLKWLAFATMLIDHVNKYLLNGAYPAMYAAGRLAMPLFAIVLAYGLASARDEAALELHKRVGMKLVTAATIATPVFIALGQVERSAYPLNILWSLAIGVLALSLWQRGWLATAIAVVIAGGALVEFWWAGILLLLAVHVSVRSPSIGTAVFVLAALAGLCVVNGNGWALLALPIVFRASRVSLALPRVRGLFYALYPLHLAVLWGLQQWLR